MKSRIFCFHARLEILKGSAAPGGSCRPAALCCDATWPTCSCRRSSAVCRGSRFRQSNFWRPWIEPHHEVFEYGCGGSTLFFAQRARSVASVEHNAKWARSVTAAALKRGLTNVAIEVREAGREPPLADSPYCLALDRPFDVVVVDGWALGKCNEADRRAVQSRAACFRRAEQFVRPGGIIVLDDAWFDPEIAASRARPSRVFRDWSLASRRQPNGCVFLLILIQRSWSRWRITVQRFSTLRSRPKHCGGAIRHNRRQLPTGGRDDDHRLHSLSARSLQARRL